MGKLIRSSLDTLLNSLTYDLKEFKELTSEYEKEVEFQRTVIEPQIEIEIQEIIQLMANGSWVG